MRKVLKGPEGGVKNVHRHLLPYECMQCVHSNGLGVAVGVFLGVLGCRSVQGGRIRVFRGSGGRKTHVAIWGSNESA